MVAITETPLKYLSSKSRSTARVSIEGRNTASNFRHKAKPQWKQSASRVWRSGLKNNRSYLSPPHLHLPFAYIGRAPLTFILSITERGSGTETTNIFPIAQSTTKTETQKAISAQKSKFRSNRIERRKPLLKQRGRKTKITPLSFHRSPLLIAALRTQHTQWMIRLNKNVYEEHRRFQTRQDGTALCC